MRAQMPAEGKEAGMPTPVLAKLFFSPPANMMKDMREEPHKLGIGQTGSGGGYGMAALEGLVAAIEVRAARPQGYPYALNWRAVI